MSSGNVSFNQPEEIFKLIQQIFSEDGLTIQSFRIQSSNVLSVTITSTDSGIKVAFIDSKPKIYINKIISLSLTLSSIYLSESGGVLEIDYFPDIPFRYNQLLK